MYSLLKYFSGATAQFWELAHDYWIDYGIVFTVVSLVIGAYFLVRIDKVKYISSVTGSFSSSAYSKAQEDILAVMVLSNIIGWCAPIIAIVIGWLGLVMVPMGVGAGLGQLQKWLRQKKNKVVVPRAVAKECESL